MIEARLRRAVSSAARRSEPLPVPGIPETVNARWQALVDRNQQIHATIGTLAAAAKEIGAKKTIVHLPIKEGTKVAVAWPHLKVVNHNNSVRSVSHVPSIRYFVLAETDVLNFRTASASEVPAGVEELVDGEVSTYSEGNMMGMARVNSDAESGISFQAVRAEFQYRSAARRIASFGLGLGLVERSARDTGLNYDLGPILARQ